MRAIGEWERLGALAATTWRTVQANSRQLIAPLCAEAAWNLAKWEVRHHFVIRDILYSLTELTFDYFNFLCFLILSISSCVSHLHLFKAEYSSLSLGCERAVEVPQDMASYVQAVDPKRVEGSLYRAILAVRKEEDDEAQKCINRARDVLAADVSVLLQESYERAYAVRTAAFLCLLLTIETTTTTTC